MANPKPAIGDRAVIALSPRSAERVLEGKILKIGPKTVTLETFIRFSPTGPWFRQEHKLRTADIVVFEHDHVRYVDPEVAKHHDALRGDTKLQRAFVK